MIDYSAYKDIKEKMGKNLYFHFKNGNGEITNLNFYKRALKGFKKYKNSEYQKAFEAWIKMNIKK